MEMRTGMPCTSSTLLSNSTPIVMSCRGLKAPPPKLDLMELLPTPAHKSAETGQTGEMTTSHGKGGTGDLGNLGTQSYKGKDQETQPTLVPKAPAQTSQHWIGVREAWALGSAGGTTTATGSDRDKRCPLPPSIGKGCGVEAARHKSAPTCLS